MTDDPTTAQREAAAIADAHTSNAGMPTYSDLIVLLQEVYEGRLGFTEYLDWRGRVAAAIAPHQRQQGRQGWDVCARQSARRLVDDIARTPIHAERGPVLAYAKHIATVTGKQHHTVTIPAGSSAYHMGYRYVSIPAEELAYYMENGATLADDPV